MRGHSSSFCLFMYIQSKCITICPIPKQNGLNDTEFVLKNSASRWVVRAKSCPGIGTPFQIGAKLQHNTKLCCLSWPATLCLQASADILAALRTIVRLQEQVPVVLLQPENSRIAAFVLQNCASNGAERLHGDAGFISLRYEAHVRCRSKLRCVVVFTYLDCCRCCCQEPPPNR